MSSARAAQRAVSHWLPRMGGNTVTIAPLAGPGRRAIVILIFALITALGFIGIPSASILHRRRRRGPRPRSGPAEHPQQRRRRHHAGLDPADRRGRIHHRRRRRGCRGGDRAVRHAVALDQRALSSLPTTTSIWNGADHEPQPRAAPPRRCRKSPFPTAPTSSRARKALLGVASRDKRVLGQPGADSVRRQLSAPATVRSKCASGSPTPDYRSALRRPHRGRKARHQQAARSRRRRVAEVTQAEDPHVAQTGAQHTLRLEDLDHLHQ